MQLSVQRIRWEIPLKLHQSAPQVTKAQKLLYYLFSAEVHVVDESDKTKTLATNQHEAALTFPPNKSLKILVSCQATHKQETWVCTVSSELIVESLEQEKQLCRSFSSTFKPDCLTSTLHSGFYGPKKTDTSWLLGANEVLLTLTLRKHFALNSDIEVPLLKFQDKMAHTDVIFIVEGTEVRAHRQILALASPVFNTMLYGDFKEATSPTIDLNGKQYRDFVSFLGLVYSQGVDMNFTHALRLAGLFHEYEIDMLEQKAEKVLQTGLTLQNAFPVLALAERYGYEELKEMAIREAAKLPTSDVFKSRILRNLSSDTRELVAGAMAVCKENGNSFPRMTWNNL